MRLSRTTALVLTAGALALAGCGGTDDADDAASRQDATTTAQAPATTAPEMSTQVTPAATATVPATTTDVPSSGGVAPQPTTTTTADGASSGGTAPPVQDDDGGTTTTAPSVDGDAPAITVREDGTARATASDAGQAEIWCDNARQGSYDAQLGQATTLVIAVSGSDDVQRCELPR